MSKQAKPDVFYVRMIEPPQDKDGNPVIRNRIVHDEFNLPHTWHSNDPTWTKVTAAHAEILRKDRLQPWRRGQLPVFEVCTEDEVNAHTREYEAQRYAQSRRLVPSVANARDLTRQGEATDGEQGIPVEAVPPPKSEFEVLSERLAAMEKQNAALMDFFQRQGMIPPPQSSVVDGVAPAMSMLSTPPAQPSTSARAAALGLDDDDENPKPTRPPTPDPSIAQGSLPVTAIPGIGGKIAGLLSAEGISTLADLSHSSPSEVYSALSSLPSVTGPKCAKWISAAKRRVSGEG